MKKIPSLFAALLFAGSMMADSYTITFKEGTGDSSDSSTKVSTVEDIISDGASYVSAVTADNVYNARVGRGIKLGTSTKPGSLTLTLAQAAKVSSIVVNVRKYNDTEMAFSIQGDAFTADEGSDFTDVTYTYATATEINSIALATPEKRIYFKSVTVNMEGGEAPKVATPVISGDIEFTDSVIVTLTCSTPSADIYYTTDGTTDPKCDCSAAPEYKKPIVIKETTTIKAAAYTGNDWSAVAEKTFTKVPPLEPITCAEVYDKAKNDKVALNDVTVTYTNGKNVYVKDATGAMLIYLPADAAWKAGDVLSGVKGVVDIYNKLYEVKPSADQVAAVTATPGEAPAPLEQTAAPVAADMNKYVILNNVTVSAATFPSNKNMDATIGEETFVLRNNFNADVAFDTEKKYDITGVVAVYNDAVQLYFINAELSAQSAVDNIAVEARTVKAIRNGQVVLIRDGKVINMLGVEQK